mgnify:FL=1
MTCIPLELAKKHLNLDEDYTEDDEYILGLVAAAKGAVEKALNASLDRLAEENGGEVPMAIIQAVLLMVGNLYQNREITGSKTAALPYNFEYLINLYKHYD